MPELPEVETTLRGVQPYLEGSTICDIEVRNASLRWPVATKELAKLVNQPVLAVERRAKYLLIHTAIGSILIHLGMSGSLRVLAAGSVAGKHDHLDIGMDNNHIVRLNDPRRFGCCLLLTDPVFEHKLLVNLGPEPLTSEFNGEVLFDKSRGRSIAVKKLIMDSRIVVGVGNIYASESLFLAGIRPTLAVKRISRARYHLLAESVKEVLADAIKAGGTTLSDFSQVDGKPGYFQQRLNVYGRTGKACAVCATPIKSRIIGQRSTFFCPRCQRF